MRKIFKNLCPAPRTVSGTMHEVRTLNSKDLPTYELRPGNSNPTLGMDNWSTFGRPTNNKSYKTKGYAEKMM